MARLASLLLAASLLTACGSPEPYFVEPSRTAATFPAEVGPPIWVGVAWISAASSDDEVVLTGAEPMDASEADAVAWFALELTDNSSIGMVDGESPLVDHLVQLAGSRVPFDATGAATMQVVARLQSDVPTRVTFDAVRLDFTVNGSMRSQVFPMQVTACVDDPKPDACD